MAENDNAVLTAAVGRVFVGAVGTAAPTPAQLKTIDLSKPETWTATGWGSVGHTSRGTLPEFGFEGGDTEVKGSWQKKKLREITTADPIDYLTIVLNEFSESSLGMYYGPNGSSTKGVFGVKTGQINEKAVLVVIEDGTFRLGHHALRASVRRDDSIDLPIDDLASLPVRFTYLDYLDLVPFSWINEDLFNVNAVLPLLKLGGATGGSFTLKVNGTPTASISVTGISATTIAAAIAAVDDGITAAQITVTASGSDYSIKIPAQISVGTNSTTGGTGVTIV